jgi:hypothetical protein
VETQEGKGIQIQMKRVRPADELEIEKRQRERLAIRFAGRKPSPFSADSDIMLANDEQVETLREETSED